MISLELMDKIEAMQNLIPESCKIQISNLYLCKSPVFFASQPLRLNSFDFKAGLQ